MKNHLWQFGQPCRPTTRQKQLCACEMGGLLKRSRSSHHNHPSRTDSNCPNLTPLSYQGVEAD